MKKLSLMKWRWVITSVLTIAFLGTTIFAVAGKGQVAQAKDNASSTVTVWIQVTDSCKHALSGATFGVSGPGINTLTTPTNGTKPEGLSSHVCPVQQGQCKHFSTGCTSTVLNVPGSGTSMYTITVAQTAPGKEQTGSDAYGANWTFAICEGGSACSKPEVATVQVTSSGSVSATVLNTYPDGTTVTWPTTKKAYSGTKSDPIMFHEFGISKTSGPDNQCDGDYDADDYLTGTPGQHCDSDSDKK
jgi:hypothetical protein